MLAPFAFLTLAILGLWVGGRDRAGPAIGRAFWPIAFGGAVIAALVTGVALPIALVWIGGFATAAWAFSRPQAGRWARIAAGIAIVTLAAGLMTHQLPGFNNPRVIDGARFSRDALPFRLHLNFDKPLV